MTSTFAEATRLMEAAESKGVKLVASPGQILNSTVSALKEALAQEVIGRICWGYGARGGGFHEHERQRGEPGMRDVDPTWYYKQGSGPIRDMAVYTLHTLVEFMGPARRVTGFSGIAVPVRYWRDKQIDVEVDDNTTLVLDFGESRFVTLFSGFIGSMGGKHAELELHGDGGSLYYGFGYRPFPLPVGDP
jgi:predicted dehydrogenase